jgi:hypothetical protein
MRVRQVLPRDAIPSVDDPVFGPDHAGDPDDDLIVLDTSPPRAYPVRFLHYHELVNDRLDRPIAITGGRRSEAVAVTWCPLCGSAVVYDRAVGDRTLTFGVSGKLADDDLVMYDRETGSEWKQSTGGGSGPTGPSGTPQPGRPATGAVSTGCRSGGCSRSPGRTTTERTRSTIRSEEREQPVLEVLVDPDLGVRHGDYRVGRHLDVVVVGGTEPESLDHRFPDVGVRLDVGDLFARIDLGDDADLLGLDVHEKLSLVFR